MKVVKLFPSYDIIEKHTFWFPDILAYMILLDGQMWSDAVWNSLRW